MTNKINPAPEGYRPSKGEFYLAQDLHPKDDEWPFVVCYAIQDDYRVEVCRVPSIEMGRAVMGRVSDLGPAIERGHSERKSVN